jgi:predicted nucleotidyltransferase
VTVVSEKSRVPKVDERALARLSEAFDVEGVVAAMLIGSQARGTAGPLSDIDSPTGTPPVSIPAPAAMRLNLISAAVSALGTDEVDVVPLNHASPLFRHRAIRDGKRFLVRDRILRVRLDTRAMLEYFDTKPLRAALSQGLHRSIREDSLVDASSIESRLQRLRHLVDEMTRIAAGGREAEGSFASFPRSASTPH